MAESNVKYQQSKFTCSCGNTYTVESTMGEKHIDVCSKCHPFYTGQLSKTRHAGKVDKFNKKYGFTDDK